MTGTDVKGTIANYSAVAFDLDGTLLNTEKGILNAIRATAAQLGYEAPPYNRLRGFIGPPIKQSMSNEYGLNNAEADKVTAVFRELYSKRFIMEATPYDGIFELLERLTQSGVRVGVATYKRTDYAMSILEGFEMAGFCDAICGDNDASTKTKAQIIADCVEKLGVEPQKTLYVGDTLGDMQGAIMSNTPFCAVTYGFGFKKDIQISDYMGKNAIFVANTVYDLIKYLFRG